MKLYAIRIFVRDWEECTSFYRDILGLPERFRNDQMGWAEYDLGGLCLGLERVERADSEQKTLVGRFVGVSLQTDHIHEKYQELIEKGVKFTSAPEKQEWGGTLAHFSDPNGNVLTLLGG